MLYIPDHGLGEGPVSPPADCVRFGSLRVDLRAAELHQNGTKIKLPEQPFQILCELIEHPGEVVTRDQLRQRLWRSDTFVDFEHGLNTAVKRLREALGDSADKPVYIETLPRHGYRLIVPVEKPVEHGVIDSGARKLSVKFWLAAWFIVIAVVACDLLWRQGLIERLRPVRIESLAVLPLENLSGDPEEEYFADGMTEALITELGKVHSLRVISHQSVIQYKGTAKAVPQIAKELNVDAVVEGSALRASGKVRITTQLIQAKPERHLWSESYERDIRDVIALQREAAQAITRQLRRQLTPEEQTNVERGAAAKPEAYDAYLLGRYYSELRSKENEQRAIVQFRRAISLDAGYAAAWAMLADALDVWAIEYGSDSDLQAAREAAARALQLDPESAEAHIATAQIEFLHGTDWSEAEAHLQRALAIAPGNSWAVRRAAQVARTLGKMDDARALAHKAVELSPLSPAAYVSFAVTGVHAGRYEEALAALDKAAQLDPSFPGLHWSRCLIYLLRSRPEEALNEAELEPDLISKLPCQAMAYYALGRKADSDVALGELIHQFNDDAAYYLAYIYATRGESERALWWLDRASSLQQPAMRGIKTDPMLNGIRSDPRFETLLRRMNLSR